MAYFVLNPTHLTHLVNHSLLIGAIFLSIVLFGKGTQYSTINCLILLVCTLNLLAISGSAIAKSRNVIQMGSLAENGVLYDYLKNNCTTHQYALCSTIDQLKNINGSDFIWPENSPVNRTDGWHKSRKEYGEIIHNIFLSPHYLTIFVRNSIAQTFKQFTSFDIGYGNISYKRGSTPFDAMLEYMPFALSDYQDSYQYQESMNWITFWKALHCYGFYLCLFLLPLLSFLQPNNNRRTVQLISLLALLMLFVNAWSSTTFSCINSRYQSRYTWIVVWLTLVLLFDLAIQYFSTRHHNIFRRQ